VSLIVHHYFPLGSRNTGDALVAMAIGKTLRRYLGDDIEIVPMPVNDRLTTGEPIGLCGVNLDRTNAEADLVIIGGSNLLEPRRRGGWGVFTDVESIRALKPPLMLIGMGTGSDFACAVPAYREPARSEVRALHERATVAAVRDDVTVDALAKIGVNATCVGCPVLSLTDALVSAVTDTDAPLLVSLPPARLLRTWRGRRYMRAAIRYIEWLQQRDDVSTIVTLHDSGDIEPAREMLHPDIETWHAEKPDALIERFGACRGVVGFRLHAALLGLGLGKPAVPVGVDWRGKAFIDTAQLGDLSIRAQRAGEFKRLRSLTDRLLANDADMLRRLADAKQQLSFRYHEVLADATRRVRESMGG